MARRDRTPPPPPRIVDRDLDGPRVDARPVGLETAGIERYQRLLANPFLGVLGLIGVGLAVRASFGAGRFDYGVVSLVGVVLVRRLFQYHCLDCGATDRLGRWREHACGSVVDRRLSGRPRRLRGPRPDTQTVLWFLALIALGLFGTVFSRSG